MITTGTTTDDRQVDGLVDIQCDTSDGGDGRLDQSDMRSQRPGICRNGPRGVVETLEGGHQGELVGGGRQPLYYQGGYGLGDTLDVGAVLVQCGIASAGQGDGRAGGGT